MGRPGEMEEYGADKLGRSGRARAMLMMVVSVAEEGDEDVVRLK